MSDLQRLESEDLFPLVGGHETMEAVPMLYLMRQHELCVAAVAPLSGGDEFLEDIADRLGVGRSYFAYLHRKLL
jgi:hypothetical protein